MVQEAVALLRTADLTVSPTRGHLLDEALYRLLRERLI